MLACQAGGCGGGGGGVVVMIDGVGGGGGVSFPGQMCVADAGYMGRDARWTPDLVDHVVDNAFRTGNAAELSCEYPVAGLRTGVVG